jgi:hypothetical protein
MYVHNPWIKTSNQSVCTGELRGSRGQLEATACRLTAWKPGEKYFEYFVFTASIAACHAQGLVAAYSRKLSATLGGSTSTRPGVQKINIKTYDFIDISNTAIPTALGGSTTTSSPIVVVILQQQLDYLYIVDYGR